MARFFFIDTNLILGYCNFLDRFHFLAIDLLDTLNINWSKYIILLSSIEKEFNFKIQKEIDTFERKLDTFFERDTYMLTTIKEEWGPLNNFDKYIFNLFTKAHLEQIDYTDFFKISLKYYRELSIEFDKLTKDWIKRPNIDERSIVNNTKIYKKYFKKVSKLIHYPDNKHITLAIYEVLRKRSIEHEYLFYTMDNSWMGLDIKIGVKNFRILAPLSRKIYIGSKGILIYTSIAIQILNKGYSCIILARGRYISKAVDLYLNIKNSIFPGLKLDNISISSEKLGEKMVSAIKLYISI